MDKINTTVCNNDRQIYEYKSSVLDVLDNCHLDKKFVYMYSMYM